MSTHVSLPPSQVRLAGFFYLCIIVCGVGGSMLLRAPLMDMADLPGSVARMAEAGLSFRLSILADLGMALADVALALVFYRLFRAVDERLSLAAMVFRLIQAAILGVNLVSLGLAISCAEQGDVVWTMRLLGAHDTGYALALFFFAISCFYLAALVCRHELVPSIFAPALALTGLLYIAGSVVRVVMPEAGASVAPLYGLTFVLEMGFCLWLLLRGVRVAAFQRLRHA